MERKILKQLAQSFVVVPMITLTLPFGGFAGFGTDQPSFQAALNEKTNNVVSSLFALNQDESTEMQDDTDKVRELRSRAIDDYFDSYNMPLAGYGMKMVLEAEKNGLDWRLLPAISVIETTGGKHLCKRLPESKNKNPFGWGSCKIGFGSFDQAIETVARNLGGNNPKTAHHYSEKELGEIIDAYNPPSIVPSYKAKIHKVMKAIGTVDLGVSSSEGSEA